MRKTIIAIAVLAAAGLAVSVPSDAEEDILIPAKMSSDELAGKLYERPDVEQETEHGNTTLDVTSFMSSDEKFGSGMYKSGKVHDEVTEPWEVDEFIYILEGSLTLTSADGTIQVINAGEAVTIPKGWTGIWDTEGFSQIWVIYSEDGSGLE